MYVFLDDWCPEPPQVSGGTVSTTGKRTGSKAIYKCHSGYILFGHQVGI